ncbi:ATP-dependent protease ATPase subunit HslU [bacterium]|nr:ATP-dependent protease ATPase subunit HslU [bacterium]
MTQAIPLPGSTPPPVGELTPRQIVAELDRYIIGQGKAKKAVAVALRNRYRRERVSLPLRDEVTPKNILMIGPTGVGKTEIARRLAKLADAPFLKVEATKFTEVGYVGRDVESMVRDLAEAAVRLVEKEMMAGVRDKADELAVERLLDVLKPKPKEAPGGNPWQAIFGGNLPPKPGVVRDQDLSEEERSDRDKLRATLLAGDLDEQEVEVDLEEATSSGVQVFSPGGNMDEMNNQMQELLGGLMSGRRKTRRVTVGEARKLLATEESRKLIDLDAVKREAVKRVERRGIIFLDEIDKVAGRERSSGPDVSREGVQRDLLPLVEGSTVNTKYGPVKTDHVLFIAAGAFHMSKPSDLIPELQGRFPIRVELETLTESDFVRILTEPVNALTRQYEALLASEGLAVEFTEDGIQELAKVAVRVNSETENIGARRLHTIVEKVLESVSFEAPDLDFDYLTVDRHYVQLQLKGILEDRDLSRYIL